MTNAAAKTQTMEALYTRLCRHLREEDYFTNCNFKEEFQTNATRVFFILELSLKYPDILPKLIKSEKSNPKSIHFRYEGNEAFIEKKLDLALQLYNKSIAYADTRNKTECLALAYGNRSAVLFELKYFKECQEDIHRALQHDYPAAKKSKLTARELKLLDTVDDMKRFRYFHPVDPPQSKNSKIQCATSKVEIQYKPSLGRHVLATDYIAPGEVIAVEKPYVAILLKNYYHKNCNNCLNFVLNPIHCELCPYAMFCNEECRKTAWQKHHEHECAIMETLLSLNLSKMAHLALRVTVTAKKHYADIIENHLNTFDGKSVCPVNDDGGQAVLDSNYLNVHYLIQNTEHFTTLELLYKSAVSAVMLSLLDQSDFFENYGLKDNYAMMEITSELLLRHFQTAPSNMHEISAWVPAQEEGDCCEKVEIGAGAYPFHSMLNHACNPNVMRHSHGADLVMRALRPIHPKEQLVDNYGYHHALSPRRERQAALKDQYFFDCQCQACIDDWPLFMQMQDGVLKKNEFLDKLIPEVQRGNMKVARESLSELCKQVTVLDAKAPCGELCAVQETLKECFALHGNVYNILGN